MCGRTRLSSDVSEIKVVFSIPPDRLTLNIAPSWNVAPIDALPVVRYNTRAREPQPRRDAVGARAVLGEGHQGRLREHQRQSRGDQGESPPSAAEAKAIAVLRADGLLTVCV
jgi:hypothetical protein